METKELIYDWNTVGAEAPFGGRTLEIDDETLRDGLQSPSVTNPDLQDKAELLRLMASLGVTTADLGLPGAGAQAREHIEALLSIIVKEKLPIVPRCACRTLIVDIAPVDELQQKFGIPIYCDMFIGSSPIRQYAEDWTLKKMIDVSTKALVFTREHNIPTMFVTEDTTRSKPGDIAALYTLAMEHGATRLCVCDTVGHATPAGTRKLIEHVVDLVAKAGKRGEVKIDWHGHRDRGQDVANSLAAFEAGADQVHACALGIGERAGNTPMEIVLVNLKLLGAWPHDLSKLKQYCELASKATGVPIPTNYPVVGDNAFETGTGVHAAAVIKAYNKGDHWLADRVYSGVPAGQFGMRQKIRVGFMSGRSNVTWVLKELGIAPTDALVEAILAHAKSAKRLLTEAEVREVAARAGA